MRCHLRGCASLLPFRCQGEPVIYSLFHSWNINRSSIEFILTLTLFLCNDCLLRIAPFCLERATRTHWAYFYCRLPASTNVGKDASAAFARASGIFIIYLTACANDFARENRRQTITANGVLAAIKVRESLLPVRYIGCHNLHCSFQRLTLSLPF